MTKVNYPWTSELKKEKCCDSDTLIEVKNLSMKYADSYAFKNINLEIMQNCVTGIIGPSGCGKSSFLQCLNRMIEVIPTTSIEGDILLNGNSIFSSKVDIFALRRKVGIVFQEPTPLPLSIETNISLPLKEHRFDRISERVEKALRDVGLWSEVKDILKTPANNLSGGQKQRLCMARTLALEPEIILMDEPCSSLDPHSSAIIEELIQQLKSKFTIVIVTHNLAQARRVCDYISTFWYDELENSGKLIESGTCHEIFENAQNKITQEYIGGVKG